MCKSEVDIYSNTRIVGLMGIDSRRRLLLGCSYLVVAGLGGCLPGRWSYGDSSGRTVPMIGVRDQ